MKLKKNHFIVIALANLDIENLISQKPLQLGASNLVSLSSKTVTARSFKLGQLIENNE